MTGTEIITQFELQVDDVTELSTSEELIIANRVLRSIYNDRSWEFLKKEANGSLLSDVDGYYITIPTDFSYFTENYNWTDNSISTQINKTPIVIFVGTNNDPYYVVNFSDRKQYKNKAGYAYYDTRNGVIRFTGMPTFSNGSTYSFDYIYNPTDIEAGTSPVIPTRFQELVIFGMAVDNDILQKSPKATSYLGENQAKFGALKSQMEWWNANLQMN